MFQSENKFRQHVNSFSLLAIVYQKLNSNFDVILANALYIWTLQLECVFSKLKRLITFENVCCLAYKTLNQYINAFITRVYHRCSICMGNQMVTREMSNWRIISRAFSPKSNNLPSLLGEEHYLILDKTQEILFSNF